MTSGQVYSKEASNQGARYIPSKAQLGKTAQIKHRPKF